jgi:hypothetical protein
MQFNWTFPQFVVTPYYSDGLHNVVTAIHWVCTGVENGVSSSNSGVVDLGTPNPAQFIPYSDITQAMAYAWVAQSISMPEVERGIAQQILTLLNPVSQPQKPPF